MHSKRLFISFPVLIVLSFLLISWGSTGHYNITQKAALSFNQEMQPFTAWLPYMADHSADADDRKSWDPNEGIRHYIDIDNYPEFVSSGAIAQSLTDLIAQHGQSVVYDNGTLPWTTLHTYDSLVKYLRLENWEKAKYYAADLTHYVADGHMPLHITKNYNGQYTGNTGIHSRYESTMINYRIGQISYTGESIAPIANVSDYVFNYMYAHYKYVDSILLADTYAQSVTGSTSSNAYKDTLWAKSQYFTPILFKNASHALAELMYNAWLEAGKPSLTGNSANQKVMNSTELLIGPNPFKGATSISFTLNQDTDVKLQVMDLTGKQLAVIANGTLSPNSYTLNWDAGNLPAGVYLVELKTPESRQVKKLVLMQ
ncbi:MAG: T9SS type A sorting domain-containing protein [Salinivirgaceae bacterium]